MATSDSFQPPGGRPQQPGIPLAQPVPQAALAPQAQPIPQPVTAVGPTVAAPAGKTARPIAVGRDPSKVAIYQRDEDQDPPEELSSIAVKHAPPWLISTVFHMVVMIVLGLIALAAAGGDDGIKLESLADELAEEDIWAEEYGKQAEIDSPLAILEEEVVREPELALSDLPEVEDPFATPPKVDELSDTASELVSEFDSRILGLALSGRDEGSKKGLLGIYGGTKRTQDAVLAGLRWLVRNQQKDGSWSLAGPYSDGVMKDFDNPAAATAMALLAFQGYGVTHMKGEPVSFRQNVARGWKWLLPRQAPDGNFFLRGGFNHRYYTQALCAIAVCELYAMTKDEKYKRPAELAIQHLLESQGDKGGWKYSPNGRSDLSVTGWVVMALQSARMGGLEVPEDHFRRVEEFLHLVSDEGGARYRYEETRQSNLAMTAEGLLCRQYLGWSRNDPRLMRGAEWITSPGNLVNYNSNRNIYYWYYATQVAHHMEGEYWRRWNNVMRQELPTHQVQRGAEKGSWDPDMEDAYESQGGRLYATCLQIYMLEVYYRHLPLYTNVYDSLRKSGRSEKFE